MRDWHAVIVKGLFLRASAGVDVGRTAARAIQMCAADYPSRMRNRLPGGRKAGRLRLSPVCQRGCDQSLAQRGRLHFRAL